MDFFRAFWYAVSGWSERYRPSNSRSHSSFSRGSSELIAANWISSSIPWTLPKKLSWPLSLARKWPSLIAVMLSISASRARRSPKSSSAPTRISHSNARLPTLRKSTRRAKSLMSLKGPSSLALQITSTGLWPTFFTAPRPNRMAGFWFSRSSMEKSHSLELTFGGSTSISIAWQSVM